MEKRDWALIFVFLPILFAFSARLWSQIGEFPTYGKLRTMHPDADETRESLLIQGRATVCEGQLGWLPWIGFDTTSFMDYYYQEACNYVNMCHSHNVLAGGYMGYFSATVSNTTDPNDMVVLGTWNNWENLTQYLGDKPGTSPLEWLQRDATGAIADPISFLGINYFMFCPNNPAVLEWGKAQLNFLLKCDFDCAYNDEIRFIGEPELFTCYCSWCQDSFGSYLSSKYTVGELSQYYGITDINSVKLPVSVMDLLWGESSQFRAWSKARYLGQLKDYAHSLKPGFSLSASLTLASDMPSIVLPFAGYDPNIIQEGMDNILFDYGGGWTANNGSVLPMMLGGLKFSNSVFYQVSLAVAGGMAGKPVVIHAPEFMDTLFPDLYTLALLRQAEVTAFGVASNIHFDPSYSYGETPPAFKDGETEFLGFIADNEDHLYHSVAYANIGLLEDIQSMQYYEWSYDKYSYFMPVGRVLADNHIPYRMISKETLETAELSQFEALILPCSPCLSDVCASKIDIFVQGGGGLLLYGVSGVRDENGHPRSKNALSVTFTTL
ncbi:MAG: hypothetical protein ACE5OR_12070 [bacterium]